MNTTKTSGINVPIIVFLIFLISSLGLIVWQVSKNVNFSSITKNNPQVEISVAFAPELEPIYTEAITEFNNISKSGKNPVTRQNLNDGEYKITVSGQNISSGEARTKLVDSVNQNSQFTPTIYAPTFSGWLDLVNFETSQTIFNLNEINSVAKSPVGIAIWESRLKAIQSKYPGQEIGLAEINSVFQSPKGWQDFMANSKRSQVYFGFTNPQISSTAVSALLTQYYASSDPNIDQLTMAEAENSSIQTSVQNYQKVIRQYSNNTVVFREYLGRGPDYIDMLPLAENDLIFVNQGKSEITPPEKLVMLYPKEGSIMHDYPMAIPQAKWVSTEQQEAAKNFIQFMLTDNKQAKFLENGFRPISSSIQLQSPISSQFGVDENKPSKTLKIPTGEVISEIQTNFAFVKKPSKINLLIDTSGSMSGKKIENAKLALQKFVEKTSPKNQVSLFSFDSETRKILDFQSLESGKNRISGSVDELQAQGGTALFDALTFSIDELNKTEDAGTIKAIVLLSDGEDTASVNSTLRSVLDKIEASESGNNSILIIPIAYGADADLNQLNAIARASKTTVQTGSEEEIDKLLETISSYF